MALLVNVKQTWPRVLAGELSAEVSVLEWWAQLDDDLQIAEQADPVIGVYEDVLVDVYDLDPSKPWTRRADGRVRFTGTPSTRWSHLVGSPNPGWKFGRRGAARSVQFVRNDVFTDGQVPVERAGGAQQATIAGYRLVVPDEGDAILTVPAGRSIVVRVT